MNLVHARSWNVGGRQKPTNKKVGLHVRYPWTPSCFQSIHWNINVHECWKELRKTFLYEWVNDFEWSVKAQYEKRSIYHLQREQWCEATTNNVLMIMLPSQEPQ